MTARCLAPSEAGGHHPRDRDELRGRRGAAELAQAGETIVHIFTETFTEPRTTFNVLADLGGRSKRVVVVGAHLDSVVAGPGINDNGSGSGMILEIAEAMAELEIAPRNTVRFAWWGAEESGLVGSEHYVTTLSSSERNKIAEPELRHGRLPELRAVRVRR